MSIMKIFYPGPRKVKPSHLISRRTQRLSEHIVGGIFPDGGGIDWS